MMPLKTKPMAMGIGLPPTDNTPAAAGGGGAKDVDDDWEMRPSGMLVQKRTSLDQNLPPPPIIRVRVKYGAVYHELNISSEATFGELKKMLTGPTGLHREDQKLIFKKKERDSKAFLDTAGVKNKSKIVLMEDLISQEKRYFEMRRTAKLEKVTKSMSEIGLEVDKLAGQEVSELESVISGGKKVPEKDVMNLIELLMNQLVKLDGIIDDVDVKVKMKRTMQVKRVQKYVETLDMLKIKNSVPNNNGNVTSAKNHIPIPVQQQQSSPIQQQQHRISNESVFYPVEKQESRHSVGVSMQPQLLHQQPPRHSTSGPVVITTQWETFDSLAVPEPVLTLPSASITSTSPRASAQPKFNWDLI